VHWQLVRVLFEMGVEDDFAIESRIIWQAALAKAGLQEMQAVTFEGNWTWRPLDAAVFEDVVDWARMGIGKPHPRRRSVTVAANTNRSDGTKCSIVFFFCVREVALRAVCRVQSHSRRPRWPELDL